MCKYNIQCYVYAAMLSVVDIYVLLYSSCTVCVRMSYQCVALFVSMCPRVCVCVVCMFIDTPATCLFLVYTCFLSCHFSIISA